MNIREVFTLDDTDAQGTIEGITAGVEFKGTNVWLLIVAIMIASLGLNVNSTAVIIGAMLISPLMGPIAGAGLALGIFDLALLKRSLVNLGIMTAISLGASTLYFAVSPLTATTTELLARTSPTFFDVLIAVFGGAAMIISVSRKTKSGNPIAGVAIATALMPPLCTAGYGLASRDWSIFLGATYLYLINSVFIGLATFAFSKYLRLGRVEEGPGTLEPRIKRQHVALSLLFGVLFVVPSLVIGYDMVQESAFQNNADRFVSETMNFARSRVISVQKNRKAKPPTIEVVLGGAPVGTDMAEHLKTLLPKYGLEGVILTLVQDSGALAVQADPAPVTAAPVTAAVTAPAPALATAPVVTPAESEREAAVQTPVRNDWASLKEALEDELPLAFPELQQVVWGDLGAAGAEDLDPRLDHAVFVRWLPGTPELTGERLQAFLRVRLGLPRLRLWALP